MKTLLIAAFLFASTSAHAERILLTNSSQSEVLAVLMIMCPECVIDSLRSPASAKQKIELKKVPDSKNTIETPAERTLASEPNKASK